MNEYLAVYPEHRFDYAQVVQNQIIDASHPPFYYALVHTVCSFFPEVFSKWLAFVINLAMMAGALIMLFKIGKRVTDNNLYALIAVGGYALSIACITTTIYLRMYASLTFFVLSFINLTIWFYEQEKVKLWQCAVLLPVVTLGILRKRKSGTSCSTRRRLLSAPVSRWRSIRTSFRTSSAATAA